MTLARLVAPMSKPAKPPPAISSGEHSKPIRVVAFNTAEGWSRDVTEDNAETLLERDASEGDLSESATTFVGRVLNTAT